jgi:superfamily II DNA/RNA helicase
MTEIQSQTWDAVVRQKKNVVGLARTVTGKTLAFVLSSKERNSSTTIDCDNENKNNNNQSIRVMIISPTGELAE